MPVRNGGNDAAGSTESSRRPFHPEGGKSDGRTFGEGWSSLLSKV